MTCRGSRQTPIFCFLGNLYFSATSLLLHKQTFHWVCSRQPLAIGGFLRVVPQFHQKKHKGEETKSSELLTLPTWASAGQHQALCSRAPGTLPLELGAAGGGGCTLQRWMPKNLVLGGNVLGRLKSAKRLTDGRRKGRRRWKRGGERREAEES